ncbi:MAG: class I SAM-dependent methyltransferase [Gaiellaceae bacterium]
MGQFHFTPEGYLERIRSEVQGYDELQERLAQATLGKEARRVLDLGVGTGESARRVLDLHAAARLTGVDSSAGMLEQARAELPADRIDALVVSRLEDELPTGPFDLVVSALAVHHLDALGKADLFRRIANVLSPGGRLVLGDVVVPERPEDAVTLLTPDFDLPDRVDDLLAWLEEAGFAGRVVWSERDLAVLVADRV